MKTVFIFLFFRGCVVIMYSLFLCYTSPYSPACVNPHDCPSACKVAPTNSGQRDWYQYHDKTQQSLNFSKYWPSVFYDPWWRHQMEIFSASLALCAGYSSVTGELPSQRSMTRSFDFYLICAWTNGWVNNREAGDLICHRAHYDVTIMLYVQDIWWVNAEFAISVQNSEICTTNSPRD